MSGQGMVAALVLACACGNSPDDIVFGDAAYDCESDASPYCVVTFYDPPDPEQDVQVAYDNSGTSAYFATGIGDLSGDGKAELMIGRSHDDVCDDSGWYVCNVGQVELLIGFEPDEVAVVLPHLAAVSTTASERLEWPLLGSRATPMADLTHDGVPDYAVTAPFILSDLSYNADWEDTYGHLPPGIVYLVDGAARGELNVADAALATWTGTEAADGAGLFLSAISDNDGDGIDDLLVGAEYDMAVYAVSGAVTGSHSLDEATKFVDFGWRDLYADMPGDVDGDGFDDFIGNYGLVRGPFDGSFLIEDEGDMPEEWSGVLDQGVGDINGDGYIDFGKPNRWHNHNSDDSGYRGKLTINYGPAVEDGGWDWDRAVIEGVEASELGASLTVIGDLDGDGTDALALGEGEELDGRPMVVWLIDQPITGSVGIEDIASPIIEATAPDEGELWGVDPNLGGILEPAGDFDGNGVPDLFVSNTAWYENYVILFGR